MSGTLTLNSHGDANALYVFQIAGALTTSGSSSVVMTGGSGCNVFWQVGGSAVLGAQTVFAGSLLAVGAITMGTGANITGAAMTQNGAVVMHTNHIASQCSKIIWKQQCSFAIKQTYDGMDKTTATANALASNLYSQGVASYYQPTFNSIFQIDKTISIFSCAQQVQSYNVVFVLHNSTGSIVDNLVITESADLSVLGSSIQPDRPVNTNTGNNAGYEVYYTGTTHYIYSTYTDYTQPTPDYPNPPPASCANSGACYVNSWTGIGTGPYNSGSYVAQAGTSAWCNHGGCTVSNFEAAYFAWYEILAPGGTTVTCDTGFGGHVNLSGGDDIYTYTINNYYSGGPGGNLEYTFNIQDMTSGTSCYVNNVPDNGYVTGPTYAYYITEIPFDCGGNGCTLAKFGTVSFTGATYNDYSDGANYYINTAISANHYVFDQMENGVLSGICSNVVQNIITSSPSTGGGFTNTYQSSANTPGGCQP